MLLKCPLFRLHGNKTLQIMNNKIKLLAFTFCFSLYIQGQPNYPQNPEKALLIYSDLEHFVNAYSQFSSETDSITVLKTYYFEKASPGLKEYINVHKLTPKLLNKAINKHPEEYSKIKEFIEGIDVFSIKLNDAYQNFHKTIPNAMYPPTYLLVGAHRGIAQASKFGQLVTILRVIDNPDKLIKLIIHELAHFQQAMAMGIEKYTALYQASNNMLALCLREGGADFITFLVLGGVSNQNTFNFLEANESELKAKFLNDLSLQDDDYWLWNSIDKTDTPFLLGYAMGHKICESYYNVSKDKKVAIKEILNLTQADDFLEKSLYFK